MGVLPCGLRADDGSGETADEGPPSSAQTAAARNTRRPRGRPVTGAPRLTRLTWTPHSQCIAPRRRSVPDLFVRSGSPTREGSAELSLTGAPRRLGRGATSGCRSRSPRALRGSRSHRAGEREAVLGEVPEELCFTSRTWSAGTRFRRPRVEGARVSCASRSAGIPLPAGHPASQRPAVSEPLPISTGCGDSVPDYHSVK